MLRFKHIILFSKILDDMDIKPYVEYLERKLQKIENEGQRELKTMRSNKVPDNEIASRESELKSHKKNDMAIDIFAFVSTNLHKVQDDLILFFQKTTKKPIEEIEDLTIEEMFEILKELFKNGIPQMLKDKVGDSLKKTL